MAASDESHEHSHGESCKQHGHGHRHGLTARPKNGAAGRDRRREQRFLILTLAVTAVILVAEVVGGFISHSVALLSDAGHMFSDMAAQVLSIVALLIATRPADARRTYGWHRLEILAALVNGITLVALAGLITWGAVKRLQSPVEVKTGVMLVIAAIGLVANLVGAWLLHDFTSLNARAAYLHVLMDALSSVAVVIGGTIMALTGKFYWLDPVISVAISLFILFGAWQLLKDAVDVLLEAVPSDIDLAALTHALDHVDSVLEVHDLHVWTITSGYHALSAHLVVAVEDESARDGVLSRAAKILHDQFGIEHVTLQLESRGYAHERPIC